MNRLNARAQLARSSATLIFSLLVMMPVMAQSASDAKPVGKSSDEAVVLNPFTITASAEKGYTSAEVVSASRFNEKIKNVPQTIVVLTDSFLKDMNAQNLVDVLPLIGATTSGATRSQDNFSIRGFGVSQTYVDGFKDVQEWGGGEFAHVQQLEVVKGPATNLFGNSKGFGGIINRISKRPRLTPFQQVSLTVGSFDNYRGAVDSTGPLNQSKTLLYRVNAAYTNNGSFRDLQSVERLFAAPVLEWKPTPATNVTFFGEFMHQRYSEDNFIPTVKNATSGLQEITVPYSRSIDEPWQKSLIDKQSLRFTADHRINEHFTARVAGFQTYIDNPIQQVEFLALAPDNRTVTRRAFDLNRWEDYSFLEANLLGSVETGFVKHQAALVTDYFYQKYRSNVRRAPLASIDLYNPVYGAPIPDFRAPSATLATNTLGDGDTTGYAITYQANFFKDRAIITAGTRHDKVTSHRVLEVPPKPYADITDFPNRKDSPRYGIVLRATDQVSVYYQYCEAFQPLLGAGFKLDGSALDPTTGKSSEYGLKLSLLGDRIQASVASFEVEAAGLAVRLPAPNNSFFANAGSNTGNGAEFNLTYNDDRLTVMLGWVNQDVRPTTGGVQGIALPGIPKNQAQLFLRHRWNINKFGGITVGGGVVYQDDRPLTATPGAQILPAFQRYFLNIGFGVRKGLLASLSVGNVFDKKYVVASSGTVWRPGEPRSIKLTLTQSWSASNPSS